MATHFPRPELIKNQIRSTDIQNQISNIYAFTHNRFGAQRNMNKVFVQGENFSAICIVKILNAYYFCFVCGFLVLHGVRNGQKRKEERTEIGNEIMKRRMSERKNV